MGTKINVSRNASQVRLAIEQPTGTDEPNAVISRHWDLSIVDALHLAIALTGEVTALLKALMQAQTTPPAPPASLETPTQSQGESESTHQENALPT